MMHFFGLNHVPDLWVNWALGSGMPSFLIGDQSLKSVLLLMRARGSVDRLRVEVHE